MTTTAHPPRLDHPASHFVSLVAYPSPAMARLRDKYPLPTRDAEPAPVVLPFKITRATTPDDLATVLDVCGEIEQTLGGRCESRLMRDRQGRVQAILFHHRPAVKVNASAAANIAQALQWAEELGETRALAPDVATDDDALAADIAHGFTEGA